MPAEESLGWNREKECTEGGIFAEQADECVLPPREWHISKGYSRIRSRMRDYYANKTMSELYFQRWNVWNRAKSILHSNDFPFVKVNKVKFRELGNSNYHPLSMNFLKEESKKGLVIETNKSEIYQPRLDFLNFPRYNCASREWIIARKFHFIFFWFSIQYASPYMNHFHYKFQSGAEYFRLRGNIS